MKWWCVVLMMPVLVGGFMGVVLTGPKSETRPLAERYASFFRVPLLEGPSYMRPDRYIMIGGGEKDVGAFVVRLEDYPHRGNHDPNYFISWMKQISG